MSQPGTIVRDYVLGGRTSSVELRMVEVESFSFTVVNRRRAPIPLGSVLRPDGRMATADPAGVVSFPLIPKSEPFELKLWALGRNLQAGAEKRPVLLARRDPYPGKER